MFRHITTIIRDLTPILLKLTAIFIPVNFSKRGVSSLMMMMMMMMMMAIKPKRVGANQELNI
jgi:hypothetical protein